MKKSLIGYFYILSSTVIYGLFGIFSRYTGKFGPFSQGGLRYGIIILIIFALFLTKRIKWKKIEKKDVKWFFIWILPASFQPVLTFVAFNHLPIGITYFLLYSTMILGGIISGKIFFGEKFGREKFASFILVFLGLYLIYKSDLTLKSNVFVFTAIFSGLIVGFWNTLTKKVSGKYSELQMIFLDSFSTLTVGTAGALFYKEALPPYSDTTSWIWIFLFAVMGLAASALLIKGFKFVEAQTGSLIMPMELFFASVFGYLFFGEILSFYVYLGGMLIAISSILPNIYAIYMGLTKVKIS